jgi:hypothetical protein
MGSSDRPEDIFIFCDRLTDGGAPERRPGQNEGGGCDPAEGTSKIQASASDAGTGPGCPCFVRRIVVPLSRARPSFDPAALREVCPTAPALPPFSRGSEADRHASAGESRCRLSLRSRGAAQVTEPAPQHGAAALPGRPRRRCPRGRWPRRRRPRRRRARRGTARRAPPRLHARRGQCVPAPKPRVAARAPGHSPARSAPGSDARPFHSAQASPRGSASR